jgi:light-regulated signal transduction histidine kinase (bacteriophytochrome)
VETARENFYHPGFGSSLLVVLVIVMTLTIVWKSGHKVAVYEEALNLQAQKLKQSNEALEESASVISHDLKAPLQTATLVYNFLQEKYANSMEKEDRWMLEAAGRGISTMTQLIDRVLDYARAANTPANLHTVDLGQIVESVRFNLKFELDESKCDLKVSWLPEVWGDEVRLTQLYQNLIENALKYRGEKSCKVELGWEDRGRFILCFVADNGRGFLQSEATRIFQPFKRSSNVGEKGGSGIGLAVCKKIVEQHGGSIWSRSAPNQGATFYFTLLKRPGG